MYSKTQLMQMVREGRLAECFDYVPGDGGPQVSYDISDLRRRAKAGEFDGYLQQVYVEQVAPFLMRNRVWEQERVSELTVEELEEPCFALLCEVNGRTEHLFVDGTHRAIRIYQQNPKGLLKVYAIPRHLAQTANLHGYRIDWGDDLQSIAKKDAT